MPAIFQSQRFTDSDVDKYEFDSCLFIDCVFDGYQMDVTHLSESSFFRCDFVKANLYWKLMYRSKFQNCNFTDVYFRGANMTEVIFSKCRLVRCDFSDDNLGGKTDLSSVEFEDTERIECIYEKATGA
jgi:fluoroquinolone resistance protein